MTKVMSSKKAKTVIKEHCPRESNPPGVEMFRGIVDIWTHQFAIHLEKYMQSIDNEGQSKKRINDDYVKAAFADFLLKGWDNDNRR